MKIEAQNMSARAQNYDRGLVSIAEPFSSIQNPALLTFRDYLRFNIEHHRRENVGYQISMSYPLSSNTGLGLAWRRFGKQETDETLNGLIDENLQRQDFVLCLGHNTGFTWGQYFEFNYENYQRRIWQQANSGLPVDYQQFRVQYRLGWFQKISPALSAGLLTPPIFAYHYRAFGEQDSVNIIQRFGQELDVSTSVPLISVEWIPKDNWGVALSNRSFSQKIDAQLAVQWRHPKWDFLQAIRYDDVKHRVGFISGLGIYLQGFEVFAGYDFSKGHLAFAASFAPERLRALVRVQEIRMTAYQLFPYRMIHDQPDCLATILVERSSQQPVELALTCTGQNLPPIVQTVSLVEESFKEIVLPVPTNLHKLPPGRYVYHLEMIAYSKGKQKIDREFMFEMKSENDWSGEPRDLVYFLRPQHKPVVDQSRRLISIQDSAPHIPSEQMARQFYQFIRDSIQYVADPQPLYNRADRGQYPSELLKSRAGDCEDFSILMISFLQSVGVDASFVEYVRPDTDQGHIFIMFNSEKSSAQLIREGKNLQRYIVRNREDVAESCYFIPLELTRKDLSFDSAWTYASELYRNLAITQNGLVDDWFHIIDVW